MRHPAVVRVEVARLSSSAPTIREFLSPCDDVRPSGMSGRAQRAGRAWLAGAVARWLQAWPAPAIADAVGAPITLRARQLGPVLALRQGRACRLLLADAVGSGKTIEAVLVLGELAARGLADRVLILTPAGLRDQWRCELRERAGITAAVIDRIALRWRALGVPSGVSPWQPPGVHVLSTELAKQPDVLAGLAGITWDVVIVDEAHGVAGDSARTAAARAIASRTRVLILITATPHAGSDTAFGRLCSLGTHGGSGPLLVFARRRDDSAPVRHRDIAARPAEAERRCLRALARYAGALERCRTPGAALAALVLRKRALSSPFALLRSVQHRIRCLEHTRDAGQQALPFDDSGESEMDDVNQPVVLGASGFDDARRELAALEALAADARAACARWSKREALLRLIRRTREHVLVFTEYRDTLEGLAAALAGETSTVTLHGGMDRGARAEAIERFTRGNARVLIATDVAAEGLNLQHACRLAVHVELPWSPARLEQRNGRVNRLGQARRVHVWRLLSDPRLESRVVAALTARLARMRASGFGPASVPIPRELDASAHDDGRLARDLAHASCDTDEEERAALHATSLARRLHAWSSAHAGRRPEPMRPAVRWMRARPVAGGVPRGVTCVFLCRPGGLGRRQQLVAVHVAFAAWPTGPPKDWLPALVARAAAAVPPAGDDPLCAMLRQRESELLAGALREIEQTSRGWQPSLFDRRAGAIVAAARGAAETRRAEHEQRLQDLAAAPPLPPVPVLVLVVR